jgi:hypothetical protein
MAGKKELYAQLIVMQSVEYTGEVRAWATKMGGQSGTISRLLRDALNRSWPVVRAELISTYGPLTAGEHWGGMLASVPAAEREVWAKVNPMPKGAAARRPMAAVQSVAA